MLQQRQCHVHTYTDTYTVSSACTGGPEQLPQLLRRWPQGGGGVARLHQRLQVLIPAAGRAAHGRSRRRSSGRRNSRRKACTCRPQAGGRCPESWVQGCCCPPGILLTPTQPNPHPTHPLNTIPPPGPVGPPSPCQQAVFECAPHHGKQWPMPQVLAHTTSHCLQLLVSSIHRGAHQGTNLLGFRV